MRIDALVAEIGSTTTVVNAFDGLDTEHPLFLGQGQGKTSVEEGDVSVGLHAAIADLKKKLSDESLSWKHFLASSSAAGGLKMTVHGLVYDMTVRAARETCLGSGGVIRYVTAGRIRRSDLKVIAEKKPNIIFLAGGTDYGERDTALYNAEILLRNFPGIPLIYAGNIVNQEEIQLMADDCGAELRITENVYPALDQINTKPARDLIHRVFEEHIVHSPGMEKIRELVDGAILPTPGAVMEMAILASETLGDLMVLDIGGATTDLHSVSDGNPDYQDFRVEAEPRAKRTVEGDLGVFVNRWHLYEKFSEEEKRLFFPDPGTEEALASLPQIPQTEEEIRLTTILARRAAELAVRRHAGQWIHIYTGGGRQRLFKGKDLTAVRCVIGTGGALTRLPQGRDILSSLLSRPGGGLLLPPKEASILIDGDYIMASLGVLSKMWPQAAIQLLLQSCGSGKDKN